MKEASEGYTLPEVNTYRMGPRAGSSVHYEPLRQWW